LRVWLARWQLRLALAFSAMLLIGSLPPLVFALAGATGVRDPLPLQDVRKADAMINLLACQNGTWPSDYQAVAPGKSASAAELEPASAAPGDRRCDASTPARRAGPGVRLAPVRWVLAFDSLLIVPGYVGWFLLAFAFALLRAWPPELRRRQVGRIDWQEVVLQLLCLIPVAAAAFDLAENGVTMIAIEDAVSNVLADDTVGDMHRATTCKWALFALSCAVAGLGTIAAAVRQAFDDAARGGGSMASSFIARMSRQPANVAGYAISLPDDEGFIGGGPPTPLDVLRRLDRLLVASGLLGLAASVALMPSLDDGAWLSARAGVALFTAQVLCLLWRMWRPRRG
jgi:hypothetical protein